MTKQLTTAVLVLVLAASQVHAGSYTYMCKVGSKSYPVTVTTPNEAKGAFDGGTITWRGMVYRNVKVGDDCKMNYVGTNKEETAELCTATKGYADLTITRGGVGNDGLVGRYECQMPRDRR